jgi:hypothetical protein
MKKFYLPIGVSVMLMSILACTDDNKKEQNKIKAKQQIQDVQLKNIDKAEIKKSLISLKNKDLKANKEVTNPLNKIRINNEFFSSPTGILKKGEKIFNRNVNQMGIIKGSIVIVVNEGEQPNQNIKNMGQITKIAKDTYRIMLEDNVDVLAIYNKLEKLDIVKVAEFEVDYTPESKNPTY